jgi:hypothetical protein
MSDAKERLQRAFPELLAALEASPAMRPYLHSLRVLLDPRTLQERVDAAIEEHIGRLTALSTRAQTGALAGRLAKVLTLTSLEYVPCDKVLRDRLIAYHATKRNSGAEIPHRQVGGPYASTIGST